MVDPLNFVKRFATNMAVQNEGITFKFIRIYLNNQIKDFTVADLDRAIRTGADLWDNSPSRQKLMGRQLAIDYQPLLEKYAKLVDAKTVVEWLAIDKPDFAERIMNDGSGQSWTWLDGQIDKIMLRLREQETNNKGI